MYARDKWPREGAVSGVNSENIMPAGNAEYGEILTIIERSRENAFRAVNRELISMYWEIGKYISERIESGGWGKSVVADFARFLQAERPDIKGFSASNIWRMRQFYETYRDNEKLATLSREISWSNNVLIMARAKRVEAREFYLLLAKENNYSARELVRQIDSMLFEREMISDERNKLFISKNAGLTALRDSYVLEFLDVPENHNGERTAPLYRRQYPRFYFRVRQGLYVRWRRISCSGWQ
jgi:predicted nuclease of restriction endonuclease-like (RecB) superfamily